MAIPKKAVTDQRKKNLKSNSEVPDGFKRDPKTGKTYRTIPKLEMDKDGFSEVMVEGLADLRGDPRDSAEEFLGHLRVAPTPDELASLRAEKLRIARKKRAASNDDRVGDDDS